MPFSFSSWLATRWWLLPLLFVVSAGSVAVNLGQPAEIALGIAAGASLLAIDWWLPAVVVNGALVGTYFAVGGDDGPVFFTIVAAVFLAATCTEVRRWLPLVIVADVAVWIGLLVRGLRWDELHVSFWQSFGVGALVAAAAAVATAARTRRAAARDRQDRAAADEKLRMAQELHDGVGHGLAVIAMQAGVALHVLDRDPAQARESLEAIRSTSKESLEALRAELATMAEAGGAAAPRRPSPGLPGIPALVERVRSAGLRVEVTGDPGPVTGPVGDAAYGVVQEALTNVLRHADASAAVVSWERRGGVVLLTVSDDGRGGAVQDEGMGIGGMRARVASVGGTMRVGPLDGGGFAVVAELPA